MGYPASDAFGDFVSKKYIALPLNAETKARQVWSDAEIVIGDECVVITKPESENETDRKLDAIGCTYLSKIRFL